VKPSSEVTVTVYLHAGLSTKQVIPGGALILKSLVAWTRNTPGSIANRLRKRSIGTNPTILFFRFLPPFDLHHRVVLEVYKRDAKVLT
jgi:hypothetical protein